MSARLDSLIKSKEIFDRYSKDIKNDMQRTAAIKAFEMCFELSWKIMRKILAKTKTLPEPFLFKDTFRHAATEGLINDPELWFSLGDARNLAAHVYKQEVAEMVVRSFYRFSTEIDALISRIKILINSGDIQDI